MKKKDHTQSNQRCKKVASKEWSNWPFIEREIVIKSDPKRSGTGSKGELALSFTGGHDNYTRYSVIGQKVTTYVKENGYMQRSHLRTIAKLLEDTIGELCQRERTK